MTLTPAARTLFTLALALGVLGASGCGAGRRITGKVTAGPAGIPVVVNADDARLEGRGIAGVDIAVSSKGEVVHRLTSSDDGSFSFHASGPVRTDQVEIQAFGEQIVPVRGTLYLPMAGQRLLIVAREKESGG